MLLGGGVAYLRPSDGATLRRFERAEIAAGTECDTRRGFIQAVVEAGTSSLILRQADPARDQVLWSGPGRLYLTSRGGCVWRDGDLFVLLDDGAGRFALDRITPGDPPGRAQVLTLPEEPLWLEPDGIHTDVGESLFVKTRTGRAFVDLTRGEIVRWIEEVASVTWADLPIVTYSHGSYGTIFGVLDPATGGMRAAFRASTNVEDDDLREPVADGRLWIRGRKAATPAPFAVVDLATMTPVTTLGLELEPRADVVDRWNQTGPRVP